MSNENLSNSPIQALYKRKAIDQLLFGFVQGAKATLEPITTEEAVRMFYKAYDLSEDDYPLKSAIKTVDRMNEDYIEFFKHGPSKLKIAYIVN